MLDSTGDATALWSCTFGGAGNVVQTADRSASTGHWSPPQSLQQPGADPQRPWIAQTALAVNGTGDAVAVWSRWGGVQGNDDAIQAAVRPVGASWGVAQDLFLTSDGAKAADDPQVALGQSGDAVAVWLTRECPPWVPGFPLPPCDGIVRAAIRPAGAGAWSSPVQLSLPGQYAASPQVAVDAAGDAIVVWSTVVRSTGSGIQASFRPASTGVWSAPEDLFMAGTQPATREVAVAFDGAGDAFVIWQAFVNGATRVEASERSASTGSWAAPSEIPGAGATRHLTLAVNAAGDAVAAWRNGDDNFDTVVQVAEKPATSGAWSSAQTLSKKGAIAGFPKVGLDASGDAVAVWQEPVYTYVICHAEHCSWPAPVVLMATHSATSATWSPSRTFASGEEPQIAVNPAGNSVAAWVTFDRHEDIVQAATESSASAAWDAPEYVSAPPPPCLVPRLIGKTLTGAKAVLRKQDCRLGHVSRAFSRRTPKGHVTAQHPRAGVTLRRDAEVAVVVSRGQT
jgi:hypothetical protein